MTAPWDESYPGVMLIKQCAADEDEGSGGGGKKW